MAEDGSRDLKRRPSVRREAEVVGADDVVVMDMGNTAQSRLRPSCRGGARRLYGRHNRLGRIQLGQPRPKGDLV